MSAERMVRNRFVSVPVKMDMERPLRLDSTRLVDWANEMRVALMPGRDPFRLGDSCPFRPLNRSLLRAALRRVQ